MLEVHRYDGHAEEEPLREQAGIPVEMLSVLGTGQPGDTEGQVSGWSRQSQRNERQSRLGRELRKTEDPVNSQGNEGLGALFMDLGVPSRQWGDRQPSESLLHGSLPLLCKTAANDF